MYFHFADFYKERTHVVIIIILLKEGSVGCEKLTEMIFARYLVQSTPCNPSYISWVYFLFRWDNH